MKSYQIVLLIISMIILLVLSVFPVKTWAIDQPKPRWRITYEVLYIRVIEPGDFQSDSDVFLKYVTKVTGANIYKILFKDEYMILQQLR